MLDYDHVANSTKDRTGIFDGKYFVIDANTGKQMYAWLSSGAVPPPKEAEVPAPTPAPSAPDEQLQKAIGLIDAIAKEKSTDDESKSAVFALIEETIGTKNYTKCVDIEKLRVLYKKLKEM